MPAMLSDSSMAVSPARCSAYSAQFSLVRPKSRTPCTQIISGPKTISLMSQIKEVDIPDSAKSLRPSKERSR
jgi:hypothetical protein